MGNRVELQSILESILGSDHVYYQPPESIRMQYPAIVYSLFRIETTKADDSKFFKHNHYRVQVISRDPDNQIANDLLDLPYCSYATDRMVVDNLYHDNLDLYF